MLVAQRLAAFGAQLVAYDPYVAPNRAALGVRLVSLDELLAEADVITVHLPKTAETVGLIGEAELARAKPGVVVINAARGGLVDEHALHQAVKDGRVGGAGIDVFASEPCTDSPLFEFDNVVVTPHLGASTDEAQEKAGVSVARSVRAALAGEFVAEAVNVEGGTVSEELRPGLPLAERLGRVFTAVAGALPATLDVEVRGEITHSDVAVLRLAALKGVFAGIVEESVSYVNAPLLAAERGLEVRLTTSGESADYRNLIALRGSLADGRVVSVAGTLTGPRRVQKLTEVDGFDLEIQPTAHLAFLRYDDRPGVVGVIGRLLGEAGINIAGMQVSRREQGGEALVALTVDSAVPPSVLESIVTDVGASLGRAVDLPEG
jgi:D-3-phosphoglycerate dehydrogenase